MNKLSPNIAAMMQTQKARSWHCTKPNGWDCYVNSKERADAFVRANPGSTVEAPTV